MYFKLLYWDLCMGIISFKCRPLNTNSLNAETEREPLNSFASYPDPACLAVNTFLHDNLR
jgi:hypothetical protein